MVAVPSDSIAPKPGSKAPARAVDCELAGILIDRLAQPSLVLDERRRIVVLNAAMAELLGGTCKDLAWRDLIELIVEPRLGAAISAIERISRGQDERTRVRFTPRKRPDLTIELEFERIPSEEAMLFLGTTAPHAALPFETLTVEVSVSADRWGRILRGAQAPVTMSGAQQSPDCCRVLCGEMRPCDDCPAVAVTATDPVASRVIEIHERGDQYVVITARRISDQRVAMSRIRLDEATRSRLAEARLDSVARRAGLSERERQVLAYLLMGLEIRDIGEVLGIAVRTVRFHQYNLLEKLGADSRADLVRFIL
jgi:DNA-binding CsgD family transcriptional regulator